jgi:ribosomal protein L29
MKSLANKSLRWMSALMLTGTLAAQVPSDQQPSTQAPVSYSSMSQLNTLLGNLEQTSQNATADLRGLRVERWKTDGNTKRQEQSDVESLLRNLQNALPGLVNELRSAPEDMAATFKLYHNLDALHDVMRSVAEAAGAFGSKNEYQALAADAERLDEVRRKLAERMQTLASSKEAELVRLRTQLKAAQAAPPPPPKKIVVDDTEPPKKAVKKKPKTPKPTTTQPAQQQAAPQSPPGQER